VNKYSGVVSETGRVLKAEPGNMQALMMRGRSYLYLNDFELAMRHFREALKFDPEHDAIKKEYRRVKSLEKKAKAGKEAMERSQWQAAAEVRVGTTPPRIISPRMNPTQCHPNGSNLLSRVVWLCSQNWPSSDQSPHSPC
jgi:tetratricopeptide (TPR) repeat protein